LPKALKRGIHDFVNGMIAGARNMIPIGVATGVAGIIIGTVSLTGAHQIIGEFVEFLSGGNLIVMLASCCSHESCFRHGLANDSQLYCGVIPYGACYRVRGRTVRSGCAA
jgi:hypothetical protein